MYEPALGEMFMTGWDYAKEGNVRKVKLMVDSGKVKVNEQTMYLKNTMLHVAVKSKQLEVIKSLIYDYNADVTLENASGKTPITLAMSDVKDEATRSTIMGLLNRVHTSTKVEKNLQLKREREERRARDR